MKKNVAFSPGDKVIAKNDPYKTVRTIVSTQSNLALCTYTDPYGITHKMEFLFNNLILAPAQDDI